MKIEWMEMDGFCMWVPEFRRPLPDDTILVAAHIEFEGRPITISDNEGAYQNGPAFYTEGHIDFEEVYKSCVQSIKEEWD